MEEKLIAFISSRINEEMRRARQAVREVIEELPLARPGRSGRDFANRRLALDVIHNLIRGGKYHAVHKIL